MTQYIGAIDQGTTSTRFMIIDKQGNVIAAAGKEHDQICKQPGWVEHDPVRIWKKGTAFRSPMDRAARAQRSRGADGPGEIG